MFILYQHMISTLCLPVFTPSSNYTLPLKGGRLYKATIECSSTRTETVLKTILVAFVFSLEKLAAKKFRYLNEDVLKYESLVHIQLLTSGMINVGLLATRKCVKCEIIVALHPTSLHQPLAPWTSSIIIIVVIIILLQHSGQK